MTVAHARRAYPKLWARGMAIAGYADDGMAGAAPEYIFPSWNYVFYGPGGYPLAAQPPTTNTAAPPATAPAALWHPGRADGSRPLHPAQERHQSDAGCVVDGVDSDKAGDFAASARTRALHRCRPAAHRRYPAERAIRPVAMEPKNGLLPTAKPRRARRRGHVPDRHSQAARA